MKPKTQQSNSDSLWPHYLI